GHQNRPVARSVAPPETYPGVTATAGGLPDGAVKKSTTPVPTSAMAAIPVIVATLPAERASSRAVTPLPSVQAPPLQNGFASDFFDRALAVKTPLTTPDTTPAPPT